MTQSLQIRERSEYFHEGFRIIIKEKKDCGCAWDSCTCGYFIAIISHDCFSEPIMIEKYFNKPETAYARAVDLIDKLLGTINYR